MPEKLIPEKLISEKPMPEKLIPFRVDFTFSDGIRASACGLCTGEPQAYVRALQALSGQPFDPPEEGILIDARFARLLKEALRDLPRALIGGTVQAVSPDGPCGAVIGFSDTASESAFEGTSDIFFAGQKGTLRLSPGQGAEAVFPGAGIRVFDYNPSASADG